MEWLNSGTSPSCRELRRCFEAVLHVLKALEPCPSSYPKDVKKCLMKCGVEDKVQVFLFCFLAAFLPIVVPPCWSVEVNSPSALALKLQLRRHPNCQRGFCRSHQQRLEQHSAQCLSEKSKKAAEWCSAVWRFCIWHRLALTSNDYALFEVVMCPNLYANEVPLHISSSITLTNLLATQMTLHDQMIPTLSKCDRISVTKG